MVTFLGNFLYAEFWGGLSPLFRPILGFFAPNFGGA